MKGSLAADRAVLFLWQDGSHPVGGPAPIELLVVPVKPDPTLGQQDNGKVVVPDGQELVAHSQYRPQQSAMNAGIYLEPLKARRQLSGIKQWKVLVGHVQHLLLLVLAERGDLAVVPAQLLDEGRSIIHEPG